MGGPPPGGGGGPPGGPGGPPGTRKVSAKAGDQPGGLVPTPKKTLWSLDDRGQWGVTLVTVGVSNGTLTEVEGSPGLEGLRVVLKEKVN